MPLLVYTLLRVLLIVLAAGVLYLLGLRDLLLVVGAVVVGALLSYVLLSGPRRRAVQRLQTFAESEPKQPRPDADALAEDEAIEGSAEREGKPDHDREQ